ncbi:MAG: patatin-like phospholipase family protein [Pseudomonadota bacterium]
MSTTESNTVSLVLSSGGARGLAHVGAIRALESLGYTISSVSGSSMGALVGGIYAAGQLDEFERWVTALRRSDIVQLLDFGWWSGSGLFKGERIIEVLRELVGEHTIEDLPIDYTAVATELNRKREVWISDGSLFDAIRASIAIPMVFTPVRRQQQVLVDGGVLNPLPIAPTLSNHTDLTIAIDVNGLDERPLNVRMNIDEREEAVDETTDGDESIRAAVSSFISELFTSEEDENDRGMIEIAMESMDAMQVAISRLKLSAYSPDVLVQTPRNIAHFFEFERAGELIQLGYEATHTALSAPDRP